MPAFKAVSLWGMLMRGFVVVHWPLISHKLTNVITIMTEDRYNNHNGILSSAPIIVSTVSSRFEHRRSRVFPSLHLQYSYPTRYYFPSGFKKTTVNITYPVWNKSIIVYYNLSTVLVRSYLFIGCAFVCKVWRKCRIIIDVFKR